MILNFVDKKNTDRLKTARELTGQDDAVLIARKSSRIDVVTGAQDFRFEVLWAASGEAFVAERKCDRK